MKKARSNDNKCCIFMDLECGVQVLGIIQLFNCVFWSIMMLQSLMGTLFSGAGVWVWIIVMFCVNIPVFIGGFYYFQYFRNKSMETKSKLPRAHLMNIVGIIC